LGSTESEFCRGRGGGGKKGVLASCLLCLEAGGREMEERGSQQKLGSLESFRIQSIRGKGDEMKERRVGKKALNS